MKKRFIILLLFVICIMGCLAGCKEKKTTAAPTVSPTPTATSTPTPTPVPKNRVVLNEKKQDDYVLGVGIPAEYFKNVKDFMEITINYEVINKWKSEKNDYALFVIVASSGDGNWEYCPELSEKLIAYDGDGKAFFNPQSNMVEVEDPSAEQVVITLNAEGAAFFAENGGMFFPEHNMMVKYADINK